ncbi:MAG: lipopolysaccharide biosynthesis protein [Rhodoferax sp.]|uniref:lipopolysaccharide biosynthesis protein n=1 Tax=Rhodoferax sp. TaxID=50421 RepID=UPI003BB5F119|nr:lipopolysaccharide biosynthesis protein [Rhodoferax sp.]
MSGSDANSHAHGPMRRVLGNFGLLVRGRGIAAVMSLGATTLMARALGPTEFGMVVLIHAYALLMRGLLDFRSVEAVVRYGVPAHDAGDTRTLRRLIKVCRRVDRRASFAATAIALILAPLIGPLMGIDRDHVMLLAAYSLVLLTTGNSSAKGILRLFDQFDVLGRQMTIGPTIRFFGVVVAWWLDSPLRVFVVILAVAYAAENLYASWRGRQEYRRRVGPPPRGESVSDASLTEFSGLRYFLWVTYWQSNMDLVPKHLSTVLAGYLLGSAEAGLLRLAQEISSLLSKPAGLIREVVFLDLTRSWHQGSAAFNLIAYRTALLGGGFGLLFVLAGYFFGADLLVALIGKKFVAAAPVLTLMLLAATFDLTASSLRSAAYAIGHADKVLRMYAVSAGIYVALFVALTSTSGLIGAGVAACVAAALPPLAIALLIRSGKRVRGGPTK